MTSCMGPCIVGQQHRFKSGGDSDYHMPPCFVYFISIIDFKWTEDNCPRSLNHI